MSQVQRGVWTVGHRMLEVQLSAGIDCDIHVRYAQVTDQLPTNETLSELFQYVIDLSHDMDAYHSQKLMEVAGIIGGVIASRAPRDQLKSLVAENERLRTCLTGISTCSTCEACRGAARLALGGETSLEAEIGALLHPDWCPSCTKPYDQCRCNGVAR